MADQRESSVLFSLKGLMTLEQERVAAEQAAEAARREALLREAEAAARLEVQGRALLAREAAERQHQIELAAREASVRDAARAEAEAEQRRIEAATAERVALELRRQEQARVVQGVDRATQRRDRLLARAGFGAAAASLLVSAGLYFGLLAPQHARLQHQLESVASAERERADEASRQLATSERRRDELARDVQRLQKEILAVQRAEGPASPTTVAPAGLRGAGAPLVVPVRRQGPCKNDGDPMNPCL